MRKKLRKYIKDYEDDMAKFRENPDLPDEDEERGIASFKALFQFLDKYFSGLNILFVLQRRRKRTATLMKMIMFT